MANSIGENRCSHSHPGVASEPFYILGLQGSVVLQEIGNFGRQIVFPFKSSVDGL